MLLFSTSCLLLLFYSFLLFFLEYLSGGFREDLSGSWAHRFLFPLPFFFFCFFFLSFLFFFPWSLLLYHSICVSGSVLLLGFSGWGCVVSNINLPIFCWQLLYQKKSVFSVSVLISVPSTIVYYPISLPLCPWLGRLHTSYYTLCSFRSDDAITMTPRKEKKKNMGNGRNANWTTAIEMGPCAPMRQLRTCHSLYFPRMCGAGPYSTQTDG